VNKKLSFRDWQKISVYLDGQMGAREQSRFEERLRTEKDLQSALEVLRLNREFLRHQPALRARRNFTLTTAMVGKRRPARAYPLLGLATALAGLFLVFLLIGDLLAQRAAPTAMPAQLAEEVQLQSGQPENAAVLSEAASESLSATSALPLEAAPMAAMPAPTESPVENPQATPLPSAKMVAPPAPAEEAADMAPTEPAVQAFSLEADSTEAEQESTTVIDRSQKILGVPRNFWRGIELLSAVVAVVCGAAWIASRRRNV
jgi:hypothetical protein